MDKAEIKDKLKNSLDMAAVQVTLFCGALAVLLEGIFILLFTPSSPYGPSKWLLFGVMALITAAPFLMFGAWRTFQIFRHVESYHFCKTVLSNPIGGRIRDTIRFTVVLEDADGCKFAANTHSIFQTHRGFGGLALEDYINKTVTVGYNEETGEVVVIG